MTARKPKLEGDPCPFCGTVPRSWWPIGKPRGWRCVQCNNPMCPAQPQVSDTNLRKALAKWNRRQ